MGFFTRYDGELREPLVWRQGSQVSIFLLSLMASELEISGREEMGNRKEGKWGGVPYHSLESMASQKKLVPSKWPRI